jgi:hypothetical protein
LNSLGFIPRRRFGRTGSTRINLNSLGFIPNLLNGITVIKTTGSDESMNTGNGKQSITAIPYYSWANRGAGEMNVWMKVQK